MLEDHFSISPAVSLRAKKIASQPIDFALGKKSPAIGPRVPGIKIAENVALAKEIDLIL